MNRQREVSQVFFTTAAGFIMTTSWYGLIITGSSKGFGKAVALAFAKNLSIPIHFVLSGRNLADLEQTKAEVLSIRESNQLQTICDLVVADLSLVAQYSMISSSLLGVPFQAGREYGKIAFINNAASLGPLSLIGSGDDVSTAMMDAFNVNVTACCYLTSEVVRRVNNNEWRCNNFLVVNLSSLSAVQPFASKGIYCAGKAARDMYHAVLAQELTNQAKATVEGAAGGISGRKMLVLNYAPGPLDTDMMKELRECPTMHKETQEIFVGLKQRNELVSTTSSAEKLLQILEKELFTSGAHIDYFDTIEGL